MKEKDRVSIQTSRLTSGRASTRGGGAKSIVTEEVWQNQRYVIGTKPWGDVGYLKAGDPSKWSRFDFDGGNGTSNAVSFGQGQHPVVKLPSGWTWDGEWEVDYTHCKTSEHGWSYGRTWNEINGTLLAGESCPKAGLTGVLRRRKWVRVRECTPLQQSWEGVSQQNGGPGFLVPTEITPVAPGGGLPSACIVVTSHTHFAPLFSTATTTAREHVSVWKPVQIPSGWCVLGHVAISDREGPPKKTILARLDAQLLAAPASYVCVWCSERQGAPQAGGSAYFWWPIAPFGFVALGAVVTNELSPPPLNAIRCVRQDCVRVVLDTESQTRIWKESGMNMSKLISIWQRKKDASTSGWFLCQEDGNRPNQVLFELYRCKEAQLI